MAVNAAAGADTDEDPGAAPEAPIVDSGGRPRACVAAAVTAPVDVEGVGVLAVRFERAMRLASALGTYTRRIFSFKMRGVDIAEEELALPSPELLSLA